METQTDSDYLNTSNCNITNLTDSHWKITTTQSKKQAQSEKLR